MPPIPGVLVEEANALFNVQLNQPGDFARKVELAYAFADKVSGHVTPYTSCKRGCTHCCHRAVHITTVEAEYIHYKTGVPHVVSTPFSHNQRNACPFLSVAGDCSIYPWRPVLCRTYHSLSDPALCADPTSVIEQYGTARGGLGNILFEGVYGWINHHNTEGGGALKDIRDFFPHPREDVQSYLALRTGR